MVRERSSTERTSVELFAGAGGLALAVHHAGFRPLLLNEVMEHACDTLEANGAKQRGEEPRVPAEGEPWPLVRDDVRELDMSYLSGKVDLLAGGPPCQPFSLGGVAKGDEDKRNMFPEMFRAIREIQPKAVICENVRGLLRPSFKPYFDYILRELEFPFEKRNPKHKWFEHDAILREKKQRARKSRHRYRVYQFSVNAADYGVPQIRNRVIIVAFRSDLEIKESLLLDAVKPTHSEEALCRSLETGEYWKRHPRVPQHVREYVARKFGHRRPLFSHDSGFKPWLTLRDAIAGFDGEYEALPPVPWDRLDRKQHDDMPKEHIGWPGARIYTGHTPNVLDRPAKAVKAGVHGVPGGESVMLTDTLTKRSELTSEYPYRYRYMTVRETARVMTFPDEWNLSGPRGEQMRQLGNAVPVRLGEVFARAVAHVLDDVESRG
ncbi:DNA cytosine methyltransferase [Saccharomonospora azurea]|uniref:DNA cytosine methyltransferase n=1 Tax=Saccharomonospora azurea TaxID=40988 RepID=UPI003D9316CF